MKKSFIYRTLQVASAVTVFSMISMWAASNHIDIISDALTQIDSLLVLWIADLVKTPFILETPHIKTLQAR